MFYFGIGIDLKMLEHIPSVCHGLPRRSTGCGSNEFLHLMSREKKKLFWIGMFFLNGEEKNIVACTRKSGGLLGFIHYKK